MQMRMCCVFPFPVAAGAATIIRQVASSCSTLQQLQAPAISSSGAIDPQQQQVAVQLLAAMAQLQGLLSDLWAAMAVLGTVCLQSEPAVASAAAAAAAAGQNLLQGLAVVGQEVLTQEQQQQEGGQELLQSEYLGGMWSGFCL